MIWESKTKQFNMGEMQAIQMFTASQILPMLLEGLTDPLVALRVLAELLLHENFSRLDELLKDQTLMEKIKLYESDSGTNSEDKRYFEEIMKRVA